VLSALVEKQGFSKTAFTDVDGLEGNVVYLHLFIDALTLQPCNPSSQSLPQIHQSSDLTVIYKQCYRQEMLGSKLTKTDMTESMSVRSGLHSRTAV